MWVSLAVEQQYDPQITLLQIRMTPLEGYMMKSARLTIFLVIACMLVLLASQSAFAAIKIVKFTVPACE